MPAPSAPLDGLKNLSPADLTALREQLSTAHYGPEILAHGEAIAPRYLDGLRLGLVHRALGLIATPAATAALLFSYRAAVTTSQLRALFDARLIDSLVSSHVLDFADDHYSSRVLITPFYDLFLLSDPLDADTDVAMGPGALTLQLAEVLPTQSPERVLDLGCGAGAFALLASRRGATHATGIDLNPRAVFIASLNASLNAISARFIEGDLTAPVRSERFDLVVSQPPFVARPPEMTASTYLHGGDDLTLSMLSAGASVLAPGGVLLSRFDASVTPVPLIKRLRDSLRDTRLDVVLFTARGAPPDVLSIAYASASDPSFGPGFHTRSVQYRNHLAATNVTEFSSALVRISRPSERQQGFAGALVANDIARITSKLLHSVWAGFDALTHDTVSFGTERLSLQDHSTLTRSTTLAGDAPGETYLLRSSRGALPDVTLSDAAAELLAVLVTHSTVTEAIARWAELTEQSIEAVRDSVLRFAREQLARGNLTVAQRHNKSQNDTI